MPLPRTSETLNAYLYDTDKLADLIVQEEVGHRHNHISEALGVISNFDTTFGGRQ